MSELPPGVARLNAPLLGQPGSRGRLETPAAVLDLPIFEASMKRLHDHVHAAGLKVRPHAKSHKCAEIARRQIAAGALGVCCAKPGELLALFEAGIFDLMLTAPVASARKIDALAKAAAEGARLAVVVDRPDLAIAYGEAAARHGAHIEVFVDLDVGQRRNGVADPAQAVEIARAVAGRPGLHYAGVQAYQGGLQHIEDYAARRAAMGEMVRALTGIIDALKAAGLPPRIVTGGGTGSHALDCEAGVLTEVQAGSYVLMDEGYTPVDSYGEGRTAFGPALRIALTVIGHSSQGFAIVDGGSKSFAMDGPAPRVFLDGRVVGRIEWCGDEFGRVLPAEGEATLPVGAIVECTAPHCDPTMNMHDVLHVVEGDRLVAFWAVEARGRAD